MAVELRVHKIENGEITMTHVFYGANEDEAEQRYEEHKAQCPALERAFESDNTIEEDPEDVGDDIPSIDDFEDEDEDDTDDEDG